jgi:hypothetical protein
VNRSDALAAVLLADRSEAMFDDVVEVVLLIPDLDDSITEIGRTRQVEIDATLRTPLNAEFVHHGSIL